MKKINLSRFSFRFFLATAGLALALYSTASVGGKYELMSYIPTGVRDQMFSILRRDIEICKAYEENLNSFPETPHIMACERRINPRLKDFSKPKWTPLDVRKHAELVKVMDKMVFYRWRPNTFDEELWRKRFEERVATNSIKLSVAQLDVVANDPNADPPDGIADEVFRYVIGE